MARLKVIKYELQLEKVSANQKNSGICRTKSRVSIHVHASFEQY